MIKCKNCGLPLKEHETANSKTQNCEICYRYEKKWSNYDFNIAYKEFVKILEAYKSQNNKYDCIVPISGGKDSTYVLHYLRKVQRLKTLAVNYDNGFQSAEANQNLKKTIEKTGSAYISYKLPWDTLKQLYKYYTLKSGGDICGTCNMGVSHAVYKIADFEQVPLIIWGYSPIHENTPVYEGKRYCREKLYKNALRNSPAEQYLDSIEYDHFKRRNNFLSLYLFNYIPYDEAEIVETLKKEYDWKEPEHGSNKADCDIFKTANYFKIKHNGYGRINIKYSALVRDGQKSLEEASTIIQLQEAEEKPEEMDAVLKKIGLSENEVLGAKTRRLDFVEKVNDYKTLSRLLNEKITLEKKLNILHAFLKPEVERDGGTIEFERIENGFLFFKLGGDCRGCFLQQVMTNYIDTLLIRYIPELKGSFPVFDLN